MRILSYYNICFVMLNLFYFKFTAKADGTLYYCQVFEYPPTPIDLHLIRYEVLISQGNKDIFHHLILYECDDSIDFSNNPNEGHECGYVYPPPNIRKCLGSQVIAVWVSIDFL